MKFFQLIAVLLSLLAPLNARADDTPYNIELHHLIEEPSPELEKMDLPKGDLASVYIARNFRPSWNFSATDNGGPALSFLKSLQQFIEYHGLTKDYYPLENIRNLAVAKDDKGRADMDVLITASLLRLAHDLHGDNVNLKEDYTGWSFHRSPVVIPNLLVAALAGNSINEFIASMAPKVDAYTQLTSALRSYRAYADKGGWGVIASGPPLRPKDHDPRVPQLRARLQAEDYLSPSADLAGTTFDSDLEKALISYQIRNGLDTDGHLGPKTLDALNTPVATRIEQIRANMERWRHMPDDYPPPRYTVVNIADAIIQIMDGDKEIYRGPVVIGKTDRKTPFIQSRVRSMIVNPSWHVPKKIARKDILPKLKKDPHYLEKLGFVMSGHKGDPYGSDIDWSNVREEDFNYQLRQEPGEQNSLGHLKFDFDNDYAVYMHGTPHQDLFDKAQRNFSSGCIRLHDPDQVGEIFLQGTSGHWDVQKIDDEVDAGKTRWVVIKNPMPLYVVYWSVFIDSETKAVNFRKDVYDYDRVLEPGYTPPEPEPDEP